MSVVEWAQTGRRIAMKQTVDSYLTLSVGDTFKVEGERGEFSFIHAIMDNNTVIEVHCRGGRKGHSLLRTFRAERVIIPTKSRKRNTNNTADGSVSGGGQ